jgi:SAM-dependent methyltransferase
MVAAVAATAQARGLANIETCLAAAEDLPFGDGGFDFLACRFSAHHWRDFDAGLREARRVLAPGARAVFIDTIALGRAALDTHLQAIELLRDTSHVRNRTEAEWLAALGRAGFGVRAAEARRLPMEFSSWTGRMNTPGVHKAAIRSLQQDAAAETIAHYEIGADGSFVLDTLLVEVGAV